VSGNNIGARNAKTSARQVARFMRPGTKREQGYLSEELPGIVNVTTWIGEKLARVTTMKTTRAPAFGGWATRIYFRAVDDLGRRWHGCSPGLGMFARMHRTGASR